MKEILQTWFKYAANNPHPSAAALVLFGASVVGVLWPEYKTKADEIARLAMCYGIINANYTTHSNQVAKQWVSAEIKKETGQDKSTGG